MNASHAPIICCGFTPCIQRVLEYAHLDKGAVNRARKVTLGIGGKGANTARMVRQLGAESLLVGFAGGANGRLLEQMLEREGVAYRHVEVSGETRICQTLIEADNPETTELVEEMPAISDVEWQAMLGLVESLDLENAIVPVSGRLPEGAPVDAYAQIAATVSRGGGHVIVDAPGEPLLQVLEHEPVMVKVNDVELLQTVSAENLFDACLSLIGRGARSVLVTRGARTAFYVDESQTLELFPPRIQAINPVGSGDAVTAGIAVALREGSERVDMLIEGMACGAANALNLMCGMVRQEDVERLREEVRIESVK